MILINLLVFIKLALCLPNKDKKSELLVVQKIVVPKLATTYWCKIERVNIENDVQISGYSAFFSPQKNKKYIHHMEVFLCNKEVNKSFEGSCDAVKSKCSHVIAAWAQNSGKPVKYPNEAGLFLPKDRFLRLEVHYNNPDLLENIVDFSGFKFILTGTKRPYNIGILEVGKIYTPLMGIPQNQKSFIWNGVCPAACTKKGLPQGGIRVVLGQLHSHLAGKKMKVEVKRGKYSFDILLDNNYSTWYEPIEKISPLVTILPGDVINVKCFYDTTARSKATLGGMGLNDEMCIAYLHYYPQVNLEVCKSKISTKTLQALLTLIYGNKKISQVSVLKLWSNQKLASLYQQVYQDSSIDVDCLDNFGNPLPGNWKNLS